MLQSTTDRLRFVGSGALPLEVSFDGGQLTSDGGLVWLEEADRTLDLCNTLAAHVPEWRRGPVRHSLATLVRQRVLQIACGYEDQNDATTLRRDPLLKHVCGRLPESGADLASQPTLSRLENAVDARSCYRLATALGELYLRERERTGIPEHVLLDLDSTDDPTHGRQEGTAYHGYYRQHMYHPLVIFDGDTQQVITALLRPGNAHAARGALSVLRRVVARMQARWPGVTLELRADSGFASPAVYDYCEARQIEYTIGLGSNARLAALAAPLVAEAEQQYAAGDGDKVRLIGEIRYQADSWAHPRRVLVKAEVTAKGTNTRFVVTSRSDETAETLYDWYVERGETEGWVKDLKRACFADRLSCRRFWANQFRLLLHVAAYWLLDTVRRWLRACQVASMQLDTLRLRLVKIGGWVAERLTRVRLRLASSHPGEPLWHHLAARPGRP
jgi:hypothetical protein